MSSNDSGNSLMIQKDTKIFQDMINFTSISYKYGIGEVFHDYENHVMYEIIGYNYITQTYQAKVSVKISEKITELSSSLVYEGTLNRLTRYFSMEDFTKTQTKQKTDKICYRIHYIDLEDSKVKGQRTNFYDVRLSNIRALARLLNSMITVNPKRRICMVTIVDEGQYVTHVRLLQQEISQQRFLTGWKERLLAHAKYKCGYEISSSF